MSDEDAIASIVTNTNMHHASVIDTTSVTRIPFTIDTSAIPVAVAALVAALASADGAAIVIGAPVTASTPNLMNTIVAASATLVTSTIIAATSQTTATADTIIIAAMLNIPSSPVSMVFASFGGGPFVADVGGGVVVPWGSLPPTSVGGGGGGIHEDVSAATTTTTL